MAQLLNENKIKNKQLISQNIKKGFSRLVSTLNVNLDHPFGLELHLCLNFSTTFPTKSTLSGTP
jgi:hypothetical protein